MTQQTMVSAFREQQRLCRDLGSDLYSRLLDAATADISEGGVVWDVMQHVDSDPPLSYPALRLLGSVHRLVLEGRAPSLAVHYPSVGGRPTEGLGEEFIGTVHDHADSLRSMVGRTPQTNEVARSAALLVGFFEVARSSGLPLRILEIGSSAGLNLAWDQYRYECGSWAWGPRNSPVRILDPFVGMVPEPAEIKVVERAGCDLAPVDPQCDDGLLTLLSYIWPDQVSRLERLRAAAALISTLDPPVRVEHADAVQWLRSQLARPVDGVATVVTHSIVTAYFDDATLTAYEQVLAEACLRASRTSPVAEVALERVGQRFEVGIRQWPDMHRQLLALAGGHGLPVEVLPRTPGEAGPNHRKS